MIDRIAAAANRDVSRETFGKLQCYVELLKGESKRQNLISASTMDTIWERHILDSAQLVRFEPHAGASWVDIGSGAGLPGIVIACLVAGPVALVEPRRLRAEFLARVSKELGLRTSVHQKKAEKLEGKFDVITGRAVAALDEFLRLSAHLSTRNSIWALPKGRAAQSELADALHSWQGTFHVEQSITDADSYVVVGAGVRPKGR